jgi:hypothetical protein
MRKGKIILTGLLVLLTVTAFAQERKYRFGLHISPNISWIKPDVEEIIYESDGAVVGVAYGGDFVFSFTPNIGIVTGINVFHTGGHIKYPYVPHALDDPYIAAAATDTGIMKRRYHLQYLEIPLMLKGSTGELLGNFSFYGQFGIGSGFNIKAKADDEYTSTINSALPAEIVENKNVNKEVSFFREALIIGIGAEYKLGKTALLQAGLTFSNGFTDILTSKVSIKTGLKEKARSNYLELNIGVMF